ncbi:hypothetical protein [Asticcacaulis solisilvae]|uniref:hypothetical protein n=1 Tax=Asticcacaulis solisilvae TaxID=1217274 RepID=UPI003FD73423
MSAQANELKAHHERAAKAFRHAADHHDWAARHYKAGETQKGEASAALAKASVGEAMAHSDLAGKGKPAVEA